MILWLCQERYAEEILGDLEEYYFKLNERNSKFKTLKYWYQSLQFMRLYALKTPFKRSNTRTMLNMNLKIAVRSLKRDKFYSFINIFGLALGIATCLFIGMFIKDEMSYDKHWANKDRIYRVVGHLKFADNEWEMATTPAPMSKAFKEDFPEIEESARFRSMGETMLETPDQKMLKLSQHAYADQDVFNIFSFQSLQGTLDISEPNTVVVSARTAKKLFGEDEAVGKSFDHSGTNYQITGVYADIPANSHFHYEVLFSMENWENSKNKEWGSNNFRTYFLLEPGADQEKLKAKFATVYEKYFSPMLAAVGDISWDQFLESGSFVDYQLQPIESIHLHSDFSYEIEQNGSFQYIILFGAAGLFVLIIACINFMNISTARSSTRAKEVGMRKVLGSLKRYLINQFMLESVLNAVIAAAIATVLLYTLLPFFNDLTDKSIANPYFGDLMLFPWMLGGTIIVGLLAGIYPALYLSSFKPIKVLKGELRLGVKSGWMRNTLVIVQFCVSVILIFGAVVINSQLDFIQNKSLGFNKDQVIILQNTYMMNDVDAFVEELRQHPTVVNATVTGFLPTSDSRSDSPMVPKESTTNDDFVSLQIWRTDEHYIPTMNMKLADGRNFDHNLATDSNAVILNQAAVDKFGFENPVGQKLRTMGPYDIFGMREFKVIGVLENFHFDSFKENINPMVLLNVRSTGSIAMRFEAGKTSELISYLDDAWNRFNPNLPFEYTFMDQQFAAKYNSEQKLGNLFNIFSGLAIFIACLGLFGLAAFTTDQRKKELGIRKVLGASMSQLMIKQLSGYTKLLIASMVVALPVGIYLMSKWLENFVYRTQISALMVVVPVLAVVLLAWVTVSIISFRAARQNPVNNLKYE